MSDEAQALAPQKWNAPAIDGADDRGFLTASRLQDLQQQAHDEAWEVGHAEGLQAGSQEIRERADRYDALLRALAKPFDLLDETVEKQLVDLSMTVAKQLFRREIQIDPSHVIGVVREAIQVLPVSSRTISVFLHPEDAVLVTESLSASEGERAWTIVEDPLISRGGCKIQADNSLVDAQAETRLQSIIGKIAGDERQ